MKVSIFINRNPSKSELDGHQKFIDTHWGQHYDSEEENRENFFDTPKFAVLAIMNNEPVGLLNIYIKEATVGSLAFSVGGIGDVVVHKEFRHKGVATRILTESIEILKSEKIDVAMLCTDITKLGQLYSKAGFIPLGKPYYFFSKKGSEKAEQSGMIAPIKSKSIFRKIMSTKEKISVGVSNF